MLKATIDGSPCCRDGTARARLQSDVCHEHHGCPAAYGGDESIVVADRPPSAAAEPPKTAGINTSNTSRRKEPPNPNRSPRRATSPRSQRIYASARAFLHGQDPLRKSGSINSWQDAVTISCTAFSWRNRAK